MTRIYLSPPHLSGKELEFVRDAFESNWIAPLGPQVDAFEQEFVEAISGLEPRMDTDKHRVTNSGFSMHNSSLSAGPLYATALSSGTAALHLALRILGLQRGEEVICSTFTFSASANAIAYEGGVPVFIDCDAASWNMDPGLLREELAACARRGKLPRAVIVVDLYGQCADYDPILAACAEYGVPVIEDAAEALGATYEGKVKAKVKVEKGNGRSSSQKSKAKSQKSKPPISTSTFTSACSRPAGSFGAAAVFSFNGNKIITTGGGGMLVSHDKAIVEKARFLATQARDSAPHYQHSEIGFNYRMSNVLAAIGRGQLQVLTQRIAARRRNFEFYQQALGDLPGIEFMPEAPFGRSARWLTCLTIDPEVFGATREDVRLALDKENIEARPVWKPMHLQPVFKGCRVRGGGVSERLFENGLCLPSGSALTEQDLGRVCEVVRKAWPQP